MITWPIFLALALAIFAVRIVIKKEEEEEKKQEEQSNNDK